MIIPINAHVIVEPVVHDSFVSSQRETYDEIGVVTILPADHAVSFKVGDKVWFDSWLAAKYPKNETENYWLVKYSDIRAYESIPKE